MTAIPDAAIAIIAAALDDYRLTTPTDQQHPRGAAERAAKYLTTSGWGLYVPRKPGYKHRAPCPNCTFHPLVTQNNLLRRHGPHGHPCPGSNTPATHPTTTGDTR